MTITKKIEFTGDEIEKIRHDAILKVVTDAIGPASEGHEYVINNGHNTYNVIVEETVKDPEELA